MKLLSKILTRFTKKTPEKKTVYLSLVLTPSTVLAAVWNMGKDGHVEIVGTASDSVVADTWDERLVSSDHVISSCEGKVGPSEIKNVILGLSEEYLTPEGEVAHNVRGPLKKILSSLGLTALGYVGLDSALSFYCKRTEGIPPSCIFIHCGTSTIDVTIYSVGQKIGREHLKVSGTTVLDVEAAMKKIAKSEILPPRIMIYGMNEQDLEEFRRSLMKHPWTAKLQFLHFPKIESIPGKVLAKSVVMAGASELVHAVSDKEESGVSEQKSVEEQDAESQQTHIQQAATVRLEVVEDDVQKDELQEEEEGTGTDEEGEEGKETPKEEDGNTQDMEEETVISQHTPKRKDLENVEVVDPTELGFGPSEEGTEELPQESSPDEGEQEEEEEGRVSPLAKLRSALSGLFHAKPNASAGKKKILFAVFGGIILVAGIAGYSAWQWFVPKATVTISVLPKMIDKSTTVTILTTATGIDNEKAVIPGKKIEKTVSGEKTATVSGTKKVGDPARGAVTLYNKSLSAKTLEKGSVFTFGSLSFTLDSDVTVASASESIGSITFGKATGALTASAIGPESNISANSEFISKEYGGNVVIARNEQALSGGTSRSVTVVTSADMNTLVTSITSELSAKAKKEIASDSSGGLTLIDSTIEVSKDISKTFDKELNQEAKNITGKVTITVTGIAYNPDDVKTLLKTMVNAEVPKGYVVNETRESMDIGEAKIAKDGGITVTSSIQSAALPVVDASDTAKKISGKSTDELKTILRDIPGISNVTVLIGKSASSGKLPRNPTNITIKLAVSK